MSSKTKIYISLAVLFILLFGKKVSALNLIKNFEGIELDTSKKFAIAYPDTGGIWTIGYGNTINKDTGQAIKQGDKIDLATAERWLKMDVAERQKRIKALIKVSVTANMLAAMTSLAYNIGTGAFASSTLLRLLNSGTDKKLVADQFLRWNKVQGKEVKGLTNRRKAERELFLK
jgi:lysozyme